MALLGYRTVILFPVSQSRGFSHSLFPKGMRMNTASRQRTALLAFCIVALALYAYGIASASLIPAHIEEIALPLDFMVGIPLIFYFLVIRPRKLSLLCIIPAIWAGYALSAFALGSPYAGILPYLLTGLIPVELAIAAAECRKLVMLFRSAKAESPDPMAWFRATMLYLVRKDTPASMTAAELSVWYYALLSWRKRLLALPGETCFSYHNAGGYMNAILGLALAFPVEIIAVHLLVSRWSVPAAIIITLLSVYAAMWLAGDARARILRPITVGSTAVRLECGIQMHATIRLADVDRIVFSESDISEFAKNDKLNYGTFYQANIWVVAKRPIEVHTMLGTKSVRAIGLSVDDPHAFAKAIEQAR